MSINKNDLLQGTLDLLILRVLATGDRHGYSIAKRIEQVSGEIFAIQMGSLYPALHRLKAKAYITSEWGITETKRKAKFYSLTKEGKKYVEAEESSWERFALGMRNVLDNA